MWFSEDFENYLKDCGYGNIWKKKIIPAFRRILTDTCLSSQEGVRISNLEILKNKNY